MLKMLLSFLNEVPISIGELIPLMLAMFFFFLGITSLIWSYILKRIYQEYLNQQLVLCEMKHSMRLIETFYSERHEYQNCLQVMKLMMAVGETKSLNNYLSKTISQTIKNSDFYKINDPILAATIISHQIKAKEYNITIKTNCTTSLKDISDISVNLGKIIDSFLDLMIESMLKKKGLKSIVTLNIEEGVSDYSFDLKLTDGSKTISSLASYKKILNNTKVDYSLQTAEVKNIINKINGKFYYVIWDDYILQLKLTVNKRDCNKLFQSEKVS